MHVLIIIRLLNTSLSQLILLPVLTTEMPAQVNNDNHKKTVTDKMDGESDEITGCIPFEEYLGTWKG